MGLRFGCFFMYAYLCVTCIFFKKLLSEFCLITAKPQCLGFFCFLFFLQLRKIVLKEKQKNYVQEEREYQDSLEYLDFDIDFFFFGFYKKNSEFFGKKRGKPLVHRGVYIFNQSNKDLRNWIFY